jgi:ubiquinone/menaquinone biosynthesis C-methylase UbiE
MTIQPRTTPHPEHEHARQIAGHYAQGDVAAQILEALRAAGKDLNALKPEDLAPVDQFHLRGRAATLELMELAQIERGAEVLDAGGGLGGAARTLASQLECRVTVLDLTEPFCRAGEMLTAATGLENYVKFQHGNALDMPFADASFDVVWTQYSSMNVADKERLYTEIFRVLRPGGTLALNELMAGAVTPPHFPAPWARDPAFSFLRGPEDVRGLLEQLGFQERQWQDMTAVNVNWIKGLAAAAPPGGPPPVGLHLLLGSETRTMFDNLLHNLDEGRVTVVYGIFGRPQ